MRCLTLAECLTRSGWSCTFAVGPETPAVVPVLGGAGYEVVELKSRDRIAEAIKILQEGVELLVVDSYGLDAGFESSCRPHAREILVVDDLANRPHDCDWLLDTAPGRGVDDYTGLVPRHCKMLLGPDYALLRNEFVRRRPGALARRREATAVDRVLVSFGLTDPSGATIRAVRGVLDARPDARIDVLLGRPSPGFDQVADLAGKHPGLRLLEYAEDMPGLMASADLAFGAAGTTSWERCCLGLPTALMILADNQTANAQGLEAAGAVVNLGREEDVTPDSISKTVTRLANEAEARMAMTEAAAGLCDGQGAKRVALALHPATTARDRGAVRLRLAGASDMETMFDWQTHPDTRRFSHNPEPPVWAEHKAWYLNVLADPERELFVITHADRAAGSLRLDRTGDTAFKVSIVVAPAYRDRGVGGAALEFANGFRPYAELQAEVLPGNEASRKMFMRAGYKQKNEMLFVRSAG